MRIEADTIKVSPKPFSALETTFRSNFVTDSSKTADLESIAIEGVHSPGI
jgi:hypothetical protein